MERKLKCVLLIDDDEAANFLTKMVVNRLKCANKCITQQRATKALEYLQNTGNNKPKPDLILLDINMPMMNGWEFLEEYQKLDESIREGVVIIMLTTSVNSGDYAKASVIDCVDGFINKPMTKAKLNEILEEHFSSKLQTHYS